MKNTFITTIAIGALMLSSCYVGIEERHHRHHGASLEIHTSNDSLLKDSLHVSASTIINQTDSLQAPEKKDVVK